MIGLEEEFYNLYKLYLSFLCHVNFTSLHIVLLA